MVSVIAGYMKFCGYIEKLFFNVTLGFLIVKLMSVDIKMSYFNNYNLALLFYTFILMV